MALGPLEVSVKCITRTLWDRYRNPIPTSFNRNTTNSLIYAPEKSRDTGFRNSRLQVLNNIIRFLLPSIFIFAFLSVGYTFKLALSMWQKNMATNVTNISPVYYFQPKRGPLYQCNFQGWLSLDQPGSGVQLEPITVAKSTDMLIGHPGVRGCTQREGGGPPKKSGCYLQKKEK